MIKIETMPAVSRNGIHKKAEAICGKNKWNMTSSYKKQFLDYESCLPFVLKRVVTFQYYFTFPTLLLSLSVPPSPSLPHLHTHTHTHTHTRWLSGKESACRCRRHRFNPWVRKIHGEGNDNHSSILSWSTPWMEEHGEVGCHALLQGIFPTQGSNPGLPYCRWILYCLSHQQCLRILEWVAYPFSRDLPNWGIKLGSPARQVNTLPAELPIYTVVHWKNYFIKIC